ncbi:MAG TPA: hypothetical protein VK619_19740, partial [Pyrinomonadaceae bacterium]|nr:hypothetical protein [Pyrinomonadaceae bacterium]
LIERAFPGVPWIFIYREPVEVMASHRRRKGGQVIPGVLQPEIFGMKLAKVSQMSPDEYCARVLAGFCEAALSYSDRENGLLINYRQLPEAVLDEIATHFKQTFSESDLARLGSAGQLDAKNPFMPFEDDSVKKQSEATQEMRQLTTQLLEPLYAQLEAKRQGR